MSPLIYLLQQRDGRFQIQVPCVFTGAFPGSHVLPLPLTLHATPQYIGSQTLSIQTFFTVALQQPQTIPCNDTFGGVGPSKRWQTWLPLQAAPMATAKHAHVLSASRLALHLETNSLVNFSWDLSFPVPFLCWEGVTPQTITGGVWDQVRPSFTLL